MLLWISFLQVKEILMTHISDSIWINTVKIGYTLGIILGCKGAITRKTESDNMKDFFLYKTELPENGGFELFGACHVLWLIVIGIFSYWLGRFLSFVPRKKKERIYHILGMVLVGIALCRDIVLVVIDHFEPEAYPLHLCNMAVWFAAIYLWTGNRFVGVVYVLLCLPAAALALVFPGWLVYPFWTFIHIYDFVYHGLVVAVGWNIIYNRELIPDWKELWKPFSFGLVGYIVLYPINQMLGTNFWFLNIPSYQSPLAWIYELLGADWYLIGHFLFCGSVVILWCGVLHWRSVTYIS